MAVRWDMDSEPVVSEPLPSAIETPRRTSYGAVIFVIAYVTLLFGGAVAWLLLVR